MTVTFNEIGYDLSTCAFDNADSSKQFILLNLLTGNINFEFKNIKINQRIDFSLIPHKEKVLYLPTFSLDQFFNHCGMPDDNNIFIKKTLTDNRSYYDEVLTEFSHFFIQSEKQSHTAAFVFLYRILERISFSIPLIYCSSQKEYKGTFEILKKLFSNDTKSDLGFLKRFITDESISFFDENEKRVNVKFNFLSENGFQTNYYEIVKNLNIQNSTYNDSDNSIEIAFLYIIDLIVKIRNNFFHARTGDNKNNLLLENLIDSDEFFSCINNEICNFLSFVCLKVISFKYR